MGSPAMMWDVTGWSSRRRGGNCDQAIVRGTVREVASLWFCYFKRCSNCWLWMLFCSFQICLGYSLASFTYLHMFGFGFFFYFVWFFFKFYPATCLKSGLTVTNQVCHLKYKKNHTFWKCVMSTDSSKSSVDGLILWEPCPAGSTILAAQGPLQLSQKVKCSYAQLGCHHRWHIAAVIYQKTCSNPCCQWVSWGMSGWVEQDQKGSGKNQVETRARGRLSSRQRQY